MGISNGNLFSAAELQAIDKADDLKISPLLKLKYIRRYRKSYPLLMNEHGEDKMKQETESNYCQIKSDILHIVESEMERIKNDPNLQHLVQEE